MKKRFWNYLPALLALLLTLGTATVFSACGAKDDGTWMRCHSAQTTIAWISLALTAALLLAAFITNKGIRAALYFAAAAGSVFVFLMPGTIMPMCALHTMRCFTVMQPFVRIMSVFTGICSIVLGIQALRRKSA